MESQKVQLRSQKVILFFELVGRKVMSPVADPRFEHRVIKD